MKQIQHLVLAAAALFAAGCGSDIGIEPHYGPAHYRLFFDITSSVHDRQKSSWPQDATRLAGGLHYGDAIDVYLIHARTADAAPLFHGDIPAIDQDATRSQKEKAKRELARVRDEAKKAIDEAIRPSEQMHVNATDVFGLFEHRPDPDRQNVYLAFTDGLESVDSKLNFERFCLKGSDLHAAVSDLMDRRGWQSDHLAGANVFFILPGVDTNDAKNCNDFGRLHAFYQTLTSALGGNLTGFDTYWR